MTEKKKLAAKAIDQFVKAGVDNYIILLVDEDCQACAWSGLDGHLISGLEITKHRIISDGLRKQSLAVPIGGVDEPKTDPSNAASAPKPKRKTRVRKGAGKRASR